MSKINVGEDQRSCVHIPFKKYLISNLKSFIMAGIIAFVFSTTAATYLNSQNIKYQKNDEDISIKEAVNELYKKAEECQLKKLGYTRLEYLESTGTQYIVTNYVPKYNTKVMISFLLTDNVLDGNIFASAWSNSGFALITYGNFRWHNGSTFYNVDSALNNEKYDMEVYGNTIIINNNKILDKYYSKLNYRNSIQLFGFNRTHMNKYKLYNFKVLEDNKIVHDYIPILDANSKPCLFDKVSKMCFYNQGTGEFLYE